MLTFHIIALRKTSEKANKQVYSDRSQMSYSDFKEKPGRRFRVENGGADMFMGRGVSRHLGLREVLDVGLSLR